MPDVPDEQRDLLWNDISTDTYAKSADYRFAVLEQYKLYVEMTDRIAGRRIAANTFFLTLNTSVLTAFGVFWTSRPDFPAWLLTFPLVALLADCAAWFYLMRSYQQLSAAKYVVVGALEERLPASPYWRAEWEALGEGKDRSKYWPVTHLERWIPVGFAITYVVGFVAALLLDR